MSSPFPTSSEYYDFFKAVFHFLFFKTDNDRIFKLSKRKIILFTSLGAGFATYWYYKKKEENERLERKKKKYAAYEAMAIPQDERDERVGALYSGQRGKYMRRNHQYVRGYDNRQYGMPYSMSKGSGIRNRNSSNFSNESSELTNSPVHPASRRNHNRATALQIKERARHLKSLEDAKNRIPSDDEASSASGFTSVSQVEAKYYPAMADVVRFKLPNSNETFTPNGDVVNENQGSESDSMTLVSHLTINTELEQLTFDHRKEIYDCLTGMERLVNSAQITLTENELRNEQNQNVRSSGKSSSKNSSKIPSKKLVNQISHVASRLTKMREQIETIKGEINSIEIDHQIEEEEKANSEINATTNFGTNYEKEVLPVYQTGRKYNVSVCASAASIFSEQTDAWFSCDSGEETADNENETYGSIEIIRYTPSEAQRECDRIVALEKGDKSNSTPTKKLHINKHKQSIEQSESKSEISSTATINEVPQKINSKTFLYDQLLPQAQTIKYRKDRFQTLKCQTFDEYLTKTEIIRTCMNNLIFNYGEKSEIMSKFLVIAGREIIVGLMEIYGDKKYVYGAETNYDKFVEYSQSASIEEMFLELSPRRVRHFNFYDVILDYMILDAFQDLSNPPPTITSVLKNRWLTVSFKETSLTTAVWSVIKTKKSKVKVQRGFLHHYYALMENISPILAWGFMSPGQSKLKSVCTEVRDEVMEFLWGIYDFGKMDYSSYGASEKCMVELGFGAWRDKVR